MEIACAVRWISAAVLAASLQAAAQPPAGALIEISTDKRAGSAVAQKKPALPECGAR